MECEIISVACHSRLPCRFQPARQESCTFSMCECSTLLWEIPPQRRLRASALCSGDDVTLARDFNLVIKTKDENNCGTGRDVHVGSSEVAKKSRSARKIMFWDVPPYTKKPPLAGIIIGGAIIPYYGAVSRSGNIPNHVAQAITASHTIGPSPSDTHGGV